jgi:hypothetical protein
LWAEHPDPLRSAESLLVTCQTPEAAELGMLQMGVSIPL